MREDLVCKYLHVSPVVSPSAYVAPGVDLMGAVTLGDDASVWYGAVLRADIERIDIGRGSNIQDGTVIHLASDRGTSVGEYVTVGHKALLHACRVDDEVLVGMGSIVMDGAEIGARSIVAAGALVPKGVVVPPGSLVMGAPAKVVRTLPLSEQKNIRGWAEKYIKVAREHREWREG